MIPAIDAASLFGPAAPARDACDRAIAAAARDIGFLSLTGFPDRQMLSPTRRKDLLRIFTIPEEEKRKLFRRNFNPERTNVYRGWYPLQDGVPSYKEGIDMGPDLAHGDAVVDPSDPLSAKQRPCRRRNCCRAGVRQQLRATWHCRRPGEQLMGAIARGLGLPERIFDAAFEGGISTLRLTRFPPRTAASLASGGGKED